MTQLPEGCAHPKSSEGSRRTLQGYNPSELISNPTHMQYAGFVLQVVTNVISVLLITATLLGVLEIFHNGPEQHVHTEVEKSTIVLSYRPSQENLRRVQETIQ